MDVNRYLLLESRAVVSTIVMPVVLPRASYQRFMPLISSTLLLAMAAGIARASFWNCCGVRTLQSHWPGCKCGEVLHFVSVAGPAKGRDEGDVVRPIAAGPAAASAKV